MNVSFCDIRKIVLQSARSFENVFLIIADFDQNNLTDINFLRASIFRKIVYLQLSFNNLHTIRYDTHLLFNNLVVLGLRGHPLIELMILF